MNKKSGRKEGRKVAMNPSLHTPKWQFLVAVECPALPHTFIQAAESQQGGTEYRFGGKTKHTFGAFRDGPSIHLHLHKLKGHRVGGARTNALGELCAG